jgi:tRNA dimethylallyltransferase
MINEGLEQEAAKLYRFRTLNPLKSVGYKEFFEMFDGKISREKAIELIKRNTRHYAKRQITWWKRDKEIIWFNADAVQEIINYIKSKTV